MAQGIAAHTLPTRIAPPADVGSACTHPFPLSAGTWSPGSRTQRAC